jgi:hypothetical protein
VSVPEALVRWLPAQTRNFAPDAEIRVPEDFKSIKLALKNMSEGQSLLVTGKMNKIESITKKTKWGKKICLRARRFV